jgi:hypothetical protein
MKHRIALVVVLAGLAGACAGQRSVTADVTRFHQMPPPGGTVAVVAPDPRKAGGVEFRDFAARVSANLARAGFPPPSGGAPDYIAELDYYQQPVAGGEDRGDGPRVSVGVGGGSGGYHSGFGMGIGTSFDVGDGGGPTALRTVTLVIQRRGDGQRVFEGRAQSLGPARNFAAAVPAMIDAVFDGFPGESGRTVTTQRPLDAR